MKSLLLDNILHKAINEFNFNSQKITFVLPSQRSIYYSKHQLKNLFKTKNVHSFFPEFITPNQLVEKITSLITPTNTDLLYYLYLSYRKIFKENPDSYSKFIKWGMTLLNDFHDVIISYPNDEVNQQRFFLNLKNIKEIEHWSLNREPLSDNQKRYLELMEKFYSIFQDFNSTLLSNGFAYPALNYQKAIEIIQSQSHNEYLHNTDLFLFIGLNAISPAEKIIYTHLQQQQKAQFYWDYDIYYIKENENHEAGRFLKENFKNFGIEKLNQQEQSYFNEPKNIYITSATNDVEEALYVKKTLQDIQQTNSDFINTAIILHNPEKLNLILSAIPENIKYNISLEYPLFLTPAYQLLIQLLTVFVGQNKYPNHIYHKNFISILLNPYFKTYLQTQYEIKESFIQHLIDKIQKQNKIYIFIDGDGIFSTLQDEYQQQTKNFLSFLQIFKNTSLPDIISNINKLYNDYLNILLSSETKDLLNINITQSICEHLNKIQELLKRDETNKVFSDITDVYILVQQIVGKEKIAFSGEPLQGLQIIGLLESRLLDFENLIIPFMNEGLFPPDHRRISFIPYDLRYYYKLPTHHHDDAIFSYLFYRNLHYPKNIYISYNNSETNENSVLRANTGEQSRYIQQIKYELSEDKKNISVIYQSVSSPENPFTAKEITIEKNDEIIKTLENIIYSPTSITTYIDCSLKFYFRYVLKLKEETEITEDLEANIEGNIFHKIMSIIYNQDVNDNEGYVDANKLKKYVDDKIYQDEIRKIIVEEIQKVNLELKGKILIKKELLTENILSFLKEEIKFIENNKTKIIYIEPPEKQGILNNEITLPNHIKIIGIPDRIDYLRDAKLYRIIDYKSSIKKEDLLKQDVLMNIDNVPKGKSINKLLQLIVYIYYASNKNLIPIHDDVNITGAILPLKIKNNSSSLYQYIRNGDNNTFTFNTQNLSDIENFITHIFSNYILSLDKAFSQTENTEICKYCQFNYICKRENKKYDVN